MMKRINFLRFGASLFILSACLALLSCPTGLQSNSLGTKFSGSYSAQEVLPLNYSAKAIIADGNVATVSILVHNTSGALAGSGSLTKKTEGETEYWGGIITVNHIGGYLNFSSYVRNSCGGILYTGKYRVYFTASGQRVELLVGAGSMTGGSIKGQALSLSVRRTPLKERFPRTASEPPRDSIRLAS
jgi:hypothetical protein